MVRRMSLVIASALMSGPGISSATAASGGGTHCSGPFDVVATPGVSTNPSSGTIATNGETGTAARDGPVNGNRPTGTGTSGYEGRYGTKGPDSCQTGGRRSAARR